MTASAVSTVLFETTKVMLYKVPPGPVRATGWKLDKNTAVWRGLLRLVEEEIIDDYPTGLQEPHDTTIIESNNQQSSNAPTSNVQLYNENQPQNETDLSDPSQRSPYLSLRAKLECFNSKSIVPGFSKEFMWAEVWYNPPDPEWQVANNGEETIKISSDSTRTYRVIAQCPKSGYHPKIDDHVPQVALAMRFSDPSEASEFSEALGLYRRRFEYLKEQLRINVGFVETNSDFDDDDSDDFDEFVSA